MLSRGCAGEQFGRECRILRRKVCGYTACFAMSVRFEPRRRDRRTIVTIVKVSLFVSNCDSRLRRQLDDSRMIACQTYAIGSWVVENCGR